MDAAKRKKLVEVLAKQPEPPLIPIEPFFDGNDDQKSIGCNLMEHPGIETFRQILTGLLKRPDVLAVYVLIAELDPGEEAWPVTDTIFVVGLIPTEVLQEVLEPLQPDKVGVGREFGIPPAIHQKHHAPVLAAWWD
jgi:hypothetical protein